MSDLTSVDRLLGVREMGVPERRSMRSTLDLVWAWLKAAVGAALGLLPHLVHHIGLLAGVALLTGTTGNLLLYAVGLILSVPLLRRLHRRFQSPWAPAIGLAVFTGMFAFSAFVAGPALIAGSSPAPTPTPAPSITVTDDHDIHH